MGVLTLLAKLDIQESAIDILKDYHSNESQIWKLS